MRAIRNATDTFWSHSMFSERKKEEEKLKWRLIALYALLDGESDSGRSESLLFRSEFKVRRSISSEVESGRYDGWDPTIFFVANSKVAAGCMFLKGWIAVNHVIRKEMSGGQTGNSFILFLVVSHSGYLAYTEYYLRMLLTTATFVTYWYQIPTQLYVLPSTRCT